jgi:hypothetical protein
MSAPAATAIAIQALDQSGRPAVGVVMDIHINGAHAGSVHSGTGSAQIEFAAPNANVTIVATFDGLTQTATAAPGQDTVVFHFPKAAPQRLGSFQSRARCPDGTTGSPCVDCPNARICG